MGERMNQHSPYRQWMRRAMANAIEHSGAQPLLSLDGKLVFVHFYEVDKEAGYRLAARTGFTLTGTEAKALSQAIMLHAGLVGERRDPE